VFTCVRSQATLRDLTLQMALRSPDMGSHEQLDTWIIDKNGLCAANTAV